MEGLPCLVGATPTPTESKLLNYAIAALRSDAGGKARPPTWRLGLRDPDGIPKDRAERRQFTVMFSDLVGQRPCRQRMEPEY